LAHRLFTVDEANRLLPTLTAAMSRLQALDAEARRRHDEMLRLLDIGRGPDGRPIMASDVRQTREVYESLVAQGNGVLRSVQAMGLEVRSIEYGLVDFPSRVGGEEAYLCWKLGESRIGYYHGPLEGYATRRPLRHVVDGSGPRGPASPPPR
jgi:hypothetical protein